MNVWADVSLDLIQQEATELPTILDTHPADAYH